MANVDTTVTATGSVICTIDSDNDSGVMEFRIDHDAAAGGPVLFSVRESGLVIVTGTISRAAAQVIETTGGGDLVIFTVSGTTKVKFTSAGLGDFSVGSVRLKVTGTAPNGATAGADGELVIYNNAGTYELWAKNGGAGTLWNKV